MSVARVTEITARSGDGFEAAIEEGLARASKTLRNVTHAWVKDQEVYLNGSTQYQVTLKVTFELDD